jgi:hypothetical protein
MPPSCWSRLEKGPREVYQKMGRKTEIARKVRSGRALSYRSQWVGGHSSPFREQTSIDEADG